jgi:hypothetical protein
MRPPDAGAGAAAVGFQHRCQIIQKEPGARVIGCDGVGSGAGGVEMIVELFIV